MTKMMRTNTNNDKAAHNHFSDARINQFHGREWFMMKLEKAVEFITRYK